MLEDKNQERTSLAQLGEFGLINHLTEHFKTHNSSTEKGVGDDAAVIGSTDKELLVTTDLLVEGVHFDLSYVPLKHLGYKDPEGVRYISILDQRTPIFLKVIAIVSELPSHCRFISSPTLLPSAAKTCACAL